MKKLSLIVQILAGSLNINTNSIGDYVFLNFYSVTGEININVNLHGTIGQSAFEFGNRSIISKMMNIKIQFDHFIAKVYFGSIIVICIYVTGIHEYFFFAKFTHLND